MSEHDIANLDEIMAVIRNELIDLPEESRAYVGGRLTRLAQELLGPVYWPLVVQVLPTV